MTASSKSALLEQIEREHAGWNQLLAEIGEGRMLQPGATGDWTFKDLVAHLNGWRSSTTMSRLEAAQHGGTPGAPPWPAHLNEDSESDVDQINAWIYETNRGRPLRDVLDEYDQSFDRMRDAVMALEERDLTEPARYPWMEGQPLSDVVSGAFGHFYEEHEAALREWLGKPNR